MVQMLILLMLRSILPRQARAHVASWKVFQGVFFLQNKGALLLHIVLCCDALRRVAMSPPRVLLRVCAL